MVSEPAREPSRAARNHEARKQAREITVLDMTNPDDNPELAEAIAWAELARRSRPRGPSKTEFSVWDQVGGGLWKLPG